LKHTSAKNLIAAKVLQLQFCTVVSFQSVEMFELWCVAE